ncbi:MAG TPA: alcohol dehydrogenase, partial [Acidobacteriota bacterium]|nr:alcohol dehydrogenase [Acidobacteriota bacterium]
LLSGVKNGDNLGLTGFGASGHLTLKIAKSKFPELQFFVFSRNEEERKFALALGANWAGSFEEDPPALLNAIIDTTPAWKPVLFSMSKLKPGGRLVINAIRKEEGDKGELSRLNYEAHLWKEKEIKSVANVTRRDVRECLKFAAAAGIQSELQIYALEDANQALLEMKKGGIRGAKVLQIVQ